MERFQEREKALRELSSHYMARAIITKQEGNLEAAKRLSRLSSQCHIKILLMDYIHSYGEELTMDFLKKMIANLETGLYK